MDLVVDANILFAAIIKDSTTRKLLFHKTLHLHAPDFLLEELAEYKDEILKKTANRSRVRETSQFFADSPAFSRDGRVTH